MTTNIQSFAGDVQIDNGNLSVKSLEVKDGVTKLGSNNTTYSNVGVMMTRKGGASNVAFLFTEDGANVVLGYTNDDALEGDRIDILSDEKANLVVYGNVYVTGSVHGDGSTLTGLVTTLQSVTEYGQSTDRTILFTNPITGINVSSNVLVSGNVTAGVYFGDGGLLSNITQTLEGITAIGNTTPYTLEFNNTTTSFVTASNVGISNALPTADLCVGANVVIDDARLNKIDVAGNVACHQLNLGTIEVLPAYSLENVTQISNTTTRTVSFNNSTLAFDTQKMAGIGILPSSADVGASGLHVDGHLRLGGAAGNTEDELMYIKAAGALGVLANHSGTNNTNTELRLQSGDTNNSNITMVGKSSAQYMTFGTNAAERVRITSAGSVGIGTTNPSYALELFKDGGDMVKIGNSTSYTKWSNGGHHIDVYNVSDGSGRLLYLNKYSKEGVEIDDRLGVGGYPIKGGANLYVYGNTYTTSNITSEDTVYAKGIVITGSGQYEPGSIYSDGNWGMIFRAKQASPALAEFLWTNSAGTRLMILDENANLGINTDAPTRRLEVVGNAYVSSNLEVGTANLFVDTTTGNVGIGTTTPGYTLDVAGTARLNRVALTPQTHLLSNVHYVNYGSGTSTTFEQVLLQFDTGGTDGTDQSEYAGYIDVEMVAQRTQSSYFGPEIFTARVNFILAWNEQVNLWRFTPFVQENKSVSSGVADDYTIFKSVPVFKYKYVDRQLQVYASFNANYFRGYTSFTARVTSDNINDVSTPGPGTLMATGTVGTAEVGMCYGIGTNASHVGIGTASPTSNLHVVGTAAISSNLEVGTADLFVDTQTGNVCIGTTNPTSNLHVFGGALSADTDLATFHYNNGNQSYLKIRQVKHTPEGSSWTAWSTRFQQVTDATNQSYIEFNPVGGTYATAFGRDTSEYMRITGAGNVSIGTTSPAYKLDVNGNARIDRTYTLVDNIVAQQVVSSTTQTVEFTGLNLTGDGGTYKIVISMKNAVNNNPNVSMYINGVTTSASYYRKRTQHTAGSYLTNSNSENIFTMGRLSEHHHEFTLSRHATSGYPICTGTGMFHTGTTKSHDHVQGWDLHAWVYYGNVNVTSLKFDTYPYSAISSGSIFTIYKYV